MNLELGINHERPLDTVSQDHGVLCGHRVRNFIKINKIQGYKTLLKDVAALWVVPSSNTKEDNFKIFAKKRFAPRQDPSITDINNGRSGTKFLNR